MPTPRATATETWSFAPFLVGAVFMGLVTLLVIVVAAIGFLVFQAADHTPQTSAPTPVVQTTPRCDLNPTQERILRAEVAKAKAEAKADATAEKVTWLQERLTKLEERQDRQLEPAPSPTPAIVISCDSTRDTRANCDRWLR